MSTGRTWTIDGLAHAIPAPELRQEFLRDVHLAPLDGLSAVFARWVSLVEQHEAARPELDALLAYAKEHDGQLPEEYQETPESAAAFDEWRQRLTADRQGHQAA